LPPFIQITVFVSFGYNQASNYFEMVMGKNTLTDVRNISLSNQYQVLVKAIPKNPSD